MKGSLNRSFRKSVACTTKPSMNESTFDSFEEKSKDRIKDSRKDGRKNRSFFSSKHTIKLSSKLSLSQSVNEKPPCTMDWNIKLGKNAGIPSGFLPFRRTARRSGNPGAHRPGHPQAQGPARKPTVLLTPAAAGLTWRTMGNGCCTPAVNSCVSLHDSVEATDYPEWVGVAVLLGPGLRRRGRVSLGLPEPQAVAKG